MKSRSVSSDLRAFLSASNVLVSSTPALKDLSREECEAIARGITECRMSDANGASILPLDIRSPCLEQQTAIAFMTGPGTTSRDANSREDPP